MWQFEGDDHISFFRMVRLVMGNVMSPTVSAICMQETARLPENRDVYLDVLSTLLKDTYVDNCFVNANSTDELTSKIRDVEECLKTGGFHFKPWIVCGGATVEQEASGGGSDC